MRQNAFLYAKSRPSKWLRWAAALIDDELAALCRQHWQLARVRAPADSRRPLAIPARWDRGPCTR